VLIVWLGIAQTPTRETNLLTPLPPSPQRGEGEIDKISSFGAFNIDYPNIAYESWSDSITQMPSIGTNNRYSDLNLTRNPVIDRDYFPQITPSDLP